MSGLDVLCCLPRHLESMIIGLSILSYDSSLNDETRGVIYENTEIFVKEIIR